MWNYLKNLSRQTPGKFKTHKDILNPPALRTRQPGSIILSGQKVNFTLVTSRLARNVHLKINPQTGLEVVIPHRFQTGHLSEILAQKQNWILKKLHEAAYKKINKPKIESGTTITILGIPKTLVINNLTAKPALRETADQIILNLPAPRSTTKTREWHPDLGFPPHLCHPNPGMASRSGVSAPPLPPKPGNAPQTWGRNSNITTQSSLPKTLLQKHFRKTAREYLTARTAQISKQMGTRHNRIAIRAQRSRWGSCSHQNNLNYNWKVILMPLPVIDYLIIHELAHTVHHNHGKRFYALVEKFCPDYKQLKKILRNTQTQF